MAWRTPPLLTLDEVAEYLRIDMETLLSLLMKEEIPHIRLGDTPEHYRVKPEDLYAYEWRHRFPPITE